jgi:PAS domain S-box-containing protein
MDKGRNLVRAMAIIGIVLVSLLIGNALFYRQEVFRDSRELVTHTHTVKDNIAVVASRVRDLELGQRGYLITRDSEFLAPYWMAVGKPSGNEIVRPESSLLVEDVRVLDSLMANPRQAENLRRLRRLVIAKLKFTDSTLQLIGTHGEGEAIQAVRSRQGKRLMDSIRGVMAEMELVEDSLLAERRNAEESELSESTLLLYGTVAFFYLLSLLALWLALRYSDRRQDAEKALRASNALMDAIINGTDYAIFASDADGIVRVFNRGAERMLGYKAEEEIGTPVAQAAGKAMLPEEVAARSQKIQEQYGHPPAGMDLFLLPLDSDGPNGIEWTYVRKDGRRISVAVSVSLLPDGGSVAIVRDITQVKLLERDLQQSSARLQAVIDGIDYAIFAADEQGILRLVNRGTERILGYSVDEMVGRPVTELAARFANADELRARASRLAKHYGRQVSEMEIISLPLPNDGPFGQEWTHKRPEGGSITLAFSVYSLTDSSGRFNGVVALARDITQIKALERMKNEFVSTVSHELRTPLTSIRGALGLVAGGATGVLPEKAAELVSIAHRNSERLVRIINDILDVEKIESGKLSMTLAPVDAAALMQQAVETHASYGEKYGVRYVLKEVPEGLRVLADADRLMQVLANLMSNAAKFSPPGSEVWLKAEVLPAKARFTVRDFGMGIPEAFRARVFEKFAQAENTDSRRYDGTGLGLNITRKLVEAMNGSIGFETREGQGTTFTFEVPLVSSQAAVSMEGPSSAVNRILICEDDRDVASLLKIMLERAGFRAEAAFSLAEARALLEKNNYAALTLDLMLPDGSGVNLLRELRADPRWVDLPVIVVSARADQGRLELNGDAIGMIDWMVKPIDEGLLLRSLHRAVAGAPGHKPRILHVEDDADLSHILGRALQEQVEWVGASSVQEAESLLAGQRFDLMVLDIGLPDGSGLQLLERLHEIAGRPVPVLILSASETGEDVRRRVEAALVKSRMSEERIVETILSLIRRQGDRAGDTHRKEKS